MTETPAVAAVNAPSPFLAFVRSIAFGALAGGISGILALLGWMATDIDTQGGEGVLALFLLAFIVGVGVGLALGTASGVLLAVWTLLRRPGLIVPRIALSILTILIDLLFIWRYNLVPALGVVALPLALASVWVGVRLVLIAPKWVDDFAARL